MQVKDHVANIQESLGEIEEAVEQGLEKKQRSLGFHISVCSTEMVEVMLHKLKILKEERILKHNDFSSIRRANDILKFEFPRKKEIINLLVEIEKKRNILCYGKRKPKKDLEEFLELFNKLKADVGDELNEI